MVSKGLCLKLKTRKLWDLGTITDYMCMLNPRDYSLLVMRLVYIHTQGCSGEYTKVGAVCIVDF